MEYGFHCIFTIVVWGLIWVVRSSVRGCSSRPDASSLL